MSFSDILAWPIEAVASAAKAMGSRGTGAAQYSDTVKTAPGLQSSAWTGQGGDSARALAAAHTEHTDRIAAQASSLANPLQDYHTSGSALKTAAQTLTDEAAAHGYHINDDGSVIATEPQNGLYAKAIAQQLADKAARILEQDQQLHQTLAAAITTALGVHDLNTAGLNGAIPGAEALVGAPGDPGPIDKTFTEADLYGPSGPSQDDIHQKAIGDCWWDASMAAVALQQPDVIKNAISYDPNTKSFTVSLYDYPQDYQPSHDTAAPASKLKQITVTQSDIQDDINALGASGNKMYHKSAGTITNDPNAPVWPAVMEAAYAKMRDGSVTAGLNNDTGIAGGWMDAGTMAITGHSGVDYNAGSVTYSELSNALAHHQIVTMGTTAAADGGGDSEFSDGIAHSHAYTVTGVSQAENGDTMVTVRNPWGTNEGIPGDENTQGGYVTFDLQQINQDGVVDYFDTGHTATR